MTANFDENSPSCAIQGISRETESRGRETSRSRRSQRVEDRKNIK